MGTIEEVSHRLVDISFQSMLMLMLSKVYVYVRLYHWPAGCMTPYILRERSVLEWSLWCVRPAMGYDTLFPTNTVLIG